MLEVFSQVINFLVFYKGFTAIIIFGLLATYFYFKIMNSKEKMPKTKTLLRGLNSPVFVVIKEKKMLNHDTMFMKLQFPGEDLALGLAVG